MTTLKRKFAPFVLACTAFVTTAVSQPVYPACKTEANQIPTWEERIDNKPYQLSRILVKARPEQVWQVITDYNGAPSVFSTMRKVHVVLDKGTSKIVHYEMRPTGVLATFQYDLEVREQPMHELHWRRVSGDFKDLEGFWKLDPVDGGRSTLVTYATYVNGGLLMPQALIKHQSHVDLPAAMAALREHAEGNVRIATSSRPSRNN